MEYVKFYIDEMNQEMVFCDYREIKDGKKTPMITRAFPLEKIGDVEPKLLKLVEGEIIGVYYERKNKTTVLETQFLEYTETIDDDTVEWIESFVKRACVQEEWDELLKPPTVDQQVEDFIKEFFEDDEEEPLEQKDFLAEFFAELEEEDDKKEE